MDVCLRLFKEEIYKESCSTEQKPCNPCIPPGPPLPFLFFLTLLCSYIGRLENKDKESSKWPTRDPIKSIPDTDVCL